MSFFTYDLKMFLFSEKKKSKIKSRFIWATCSVLRIQFLEDRTIFANEFKHQNHSDLNTYIFINKVPLYKWDPQFYRKGPLLL